MTVGVRNPIDSTSYASDESVIISHDYLYIDASGRREDGGADVFAPAYGYQLDDVAHLQAAVQAGAGVGAGALGFSATPLPTCTQGTPESAAISP